MDDNSDYEEYVFNDGLSHRLLGNRSIHADIRIFLKKNRMRILLVLSMTIILSILLTILILVVRPHSKENDHLLPSSTKMSISLTDLTELKKQDNTPFEVNWKQLVNELANKLYDLYNWNDYEPITLFNKTCIPQIKGKFHRLKWMWDAKIECDGIVGKSAQYAGRETAVKKALEDYLREFARSH